MLRVLIKHSVRHIRNNLSISIIQIVGLGIALGCAILMGTYILHEFSFDKYHKNCNKIFRVVVNNDCSTPYALGSEFQKEIPGIEQVFRLYQIRNTSIKKEKDFIKEDIILADNEIFSILDITVLIGNKGNLLSEPTSIVISDKMMLKYFNKNNPVGKILSVSVSGRMVEFKVTGVFKSFPSYSSLQSECIANLDQAFAEKMNATGIFSKFPEQDYEKIKQNWDENGFETFVLTSDNLNIKIAEKKCSSFIQNITKKPDKVVLQPFSEMYLKSDNLNYTFLQTSQLDTLQIYACIAVLVLLIAVINYILLSLADAQKQLKEVACHKTNGASRFDIQMKYLSNSMLVSFLSIIPAILFISVVIPFFNELYDKNLSIQLFLQLPYLILLLIFIILTGLLAGAYISFYASRLSPSILMGHSTFSGLKKRSKKGILITIQFIIFIFLCSTTLIMEKQLFFSTNINQGFDSDNILIFRIDNQAAQKQLEILKSKIWENPHVLDVAGSSITPPTQSSFYLTIDRDGYGKNLVSEDGIFIGSNLITLLKIPFIEGKDYDPEEKSWQTNDIIINQSAAKKYHVGVGQKLGGFDIRAVVADFHAHSIHRFINPLLLLVIGNDATTELVVKTDVHHAEVIEHVQNVWREVLPSNYMEYESLNDKISDFYEKEKRQTQSILFFTFIAIVLAIMGLFGYVSMSLIQRTKEIGIRKVNGARTPELIRMLCINYTKWISIAFIVATPIAWYAMRKWLENFAYKTELSWWIFALAGFIAFAVALLTISWQSWRAATKNPVESLRYE